MKKSLVNIAGILKGVAFVIALITILLQPLGQAFFLLGDAEIEVSEVDFEEDSEEQEEKKEDDSKNEKIELQHTNAHSQSILFLSKNRSYQLLQLVQNFDPDILIPPPEQV
ncbi:hypothetical protein [Spongiivirga citrea]|uniref:Uncharacterized protein n=1 Tax=Spongiivirga citrea TaxID=1481457 RepID=A0A6M0CLZ9_9FLAO|nr:hypothetical protein [Spongiivirga citrea]NER16859.1 hypothetical protein [Spongiivirga citrea]